MTLMELSEQLGVSVATVSNAITGKGRMREEKRREILEFALTHGYDVSNTESRQWKKDVRVIVEQISVLYSDEIVNGICEAADAVGILPSIHNMNLLNKTDALNPNPDIAVTSELARRMLCQISPTASGLIYVSQYPRDITGTLPAIPYPLVYAYCYTKERNACVNYDDAQGAYIATEHLIQRGRKRIAMISGPINSIPMTKRMLGYQRALVENGLAFDPQMMRVGNWSLENGYQHMMELLDCDPQPDAVFCQSDHIAAGTVRAIRARGLRVPQDVAVVGFDNLEFSRVGEPQLTTIAPPCHEIGRQAFTYLWDIMNKRTQDGRSIKVECSLIQRETT